MIPFFRSDNSWNNIKWKYSFNADIVAINGKCDALVHKKFTCQCIFLVKIAGIQLLQSVKYLLVLFTNLIFVAHFIPYTFPATVSMQKIYRAHKPNLNK